jgi:hypothetical protein
MKCVRLSLFCLSVLVSGCTTQSDYMVHFRSVAPFRPKDPNELLAELTGKLPAGVEIRHFLYRQRANEIRGIVVVRGVGVCDIMRGTIRDNPRLQLAGPGCERVHSTGKSLICFSSQPPFMPKGAPGLLAELQRGLPPDIRPTVVRSIRGSDRITVWIHVKGNFDREAVKFAIHQNPNLTLLQVENAPLFSCLPAARRIQSRHGNIPDSRDTETGT